MAIAIFVGFVLFVIGLSFYLGHRTKTSSGYYAAGGQIHWGVNGIAFGGGCEVTEAVHIALASERATFAKPEIKLGMPPTFGGTQRLSRLTGRKRALELLLTGENVAHTRHQNGTGVPRPGNDGDDVRGHVPAIGPDLVGREFERQIGRFPCKRMSGRINTLVPCEGQAVVGGDNR